VLPHIKAGKLRAIAVTTGTRSPNCPMCRPCRVRHSRLRIDRMVRHGGAGRDAEEIITKLNAEAVKS